MFSRSRRLTLCLLLAAPASAGWFSRKAQAQKAGSVQPAEAGFITPEMDRLLLEGLDDLFRMRFDRAEEEVRRAMALNPEHPHAYLGLAALTWARYVYESEQTDQELLVPFEAQIQKTIEVSQAWLKIHPRDAQALMVLGAAYGIKSRLLLTRREWLKGYWSGHKAVAVTRAAAKADPDLWDAYLGLGMYDYYSDLYPRFIGVLARIVLRGNRQRGIETLRAVAEKGHYTRNAARMLLVEIYVEDPYGARDPEKAVEITRGMRAQYPESSMMHSSELVALYEAGRYGEAAAGGEDFIERVKAGRYNPIDMAKGQVILGCAHWALERREKALEAFRAGNGVRYQGRATRWSVWAHNRAGELLDSLGRRREAVRDYKTVLAAPDLWDIHRIAKSRLSQPFKGDRPGPIPPP